MFPDKRILRQRDLRLNLIKDRSLRDTAQAEMSAVLGILYSSCRSAGKSDARFQPDYPVNKPVPDSGPLSNTFYVDADLQAGTVHAVRLVAEEFGEVSVAFSFPHKARIAGPGKEATLEDRNIVSLEDFCFDPRFAELNPPPYPGTLHERAFLALSLAKPVKIPPHPGIIT